MLWRFETSRSSLEEEGSLYDNPLTTKRTFEKPRKIERKNEDASNAVIQITSLVIVQRTIPVIKKHSLSGVGVIAETNPRRKKFVSWLTQMRYLPTLSIIVVHH